MHRRFVYLMISTISSAIADFLAKILFKQHHGLTTAGYLVFSWLVELLVLGIYVVWWKWWVTELLYGNALFRLVLMVVIWLRFVGNLLYYGGMRRLDASVVTVVFTLSTLVSIAVGVWRYDESLAWTKLLGWVLTIGAVFVVYYHIERKKQRFRLFWRVIASAVLYGIIVNIEKFVWLSFDPFVFRRWYGMGSVLWLLLFYRHDVLHDTKYLHSASFWCINSVSALLWMVMNVSYYVAFAIGAEAGKTDAINNIAIFFIIALEYFFFRDRGRWQWKLLAAVLSTIGVWLLYYST